MKSIKALMFVIWTTASTMAAGINEKNGIVVNWLMNDSMEFVTVTGNNEWNVSDETSTMVTALASSKDQLHFPVRIGQWMVMGCQQDDQSWQCDLRRLTMLSTHGFIDVLKFSVRKDKWLNVVNTKCRGEHDSAAPAVDVGNGRQMKFRIVVNCGANEKKPSVNGCSEDVMNRIKCVYFQIGFVVALMIFLFSLVCCSCLAKSMDAGNKKRPISTNPPPPQPMESIKDEPIKW